MIVLTIVLLFSPILIAAACANPGLIVLLAVLWCGIAVPAGGAEPAAVVPAASVGTGEVAATPLDVPKAPAAEEIALEPPAENFALGNGIPVVFKRGEGAEIVNIGVFLNMGSAFEDEKQNGISALTVQLLQKGTRKRDAAAFAKALESDGSRIMVEAGKRIATVSLKCTTGALDRSLELLAEAILEPSFPEAEVRAEKQFLLAAIAREKDDMNANTDLLFARTLYPEHPYRLPIHGTEETVKRLTRSDVVKRHRECFVTGNVRIAVVGNIERAALAAKLEARFAAIPKGAAPERVARFTERTANLFKVPEKPVEAFEFRDKKQAMIAYGFPVPGITSVEYPALKMAAAILGTGMSCRLFSELRDKESLAYVVYAAYPSSTDLGIFYVKLGCQPEKFDRALEGIKRELERFRAGPITDEELNRARNKVIGDQAIAHQTMSRQMSLMGLFEMMGVGAEFDRTYTRRLVGVSKDEIQAVARKFFDPAHAVTAVTRNKK